MVEIVLISIFLNFLACSFLSIFLVITKSKYRLFTLFNINLLIWSVFYALAITTKEYGMALFYIKAAFIFIMFIPYLTFNFCAEIAEYKVNPAIKIAKFSFVLFIIILLPTSLLIEGVIPFMEFDYIPKVTLLWYLIPLYFAVEVFSGLYILYKKARSSSNTNIRIKYIFISTVIGFSGGVTNFFPYIGIEIYPLGNFLIAIYSIALTYLMIKHRLFDASVIWSSVLSRISTLCLLLLLYVFLFFIHQSIIPSDSHYFTVGTLNLIFLLICCEFYQSIIQKFQNIYGNVIYKKSYGYEEVSTKINQLLSKIVEINDLKTVLVDFFSKNISIGISAIYVDSTWLYDDQKKEMQCVYGSSKIDHNLLKEVKKIKLPLSYRESNTEIKGLLDCVNASCLIPFVFNNNVVGFCCVRQRSYNHHFDYYDLLLFDSLTFLVGNSLERIKSHLKLLRVEKDRAEILKSLAGSIAHEIRNPLNSINLVGTQIDELLLDEDSHKTSKATHEKNRKKLLKLTSRISQSINSANNIINIILSDLKDQKIDPRDFDHINPVKIIPEVIEKYGYRTEIEKKKVKMDDSLREAIRSRDNSFIFKGVEDRFIFIIFNLMKNALYYLNEYPDSEVTIGLKRRVINKKKYNTIYVYDTGPGIPKDALDRLFEDYYTSGKKGGTGLGLAFCKRNMKMFGGDIICESEVGKWTRFSLLFPKISKKGLETIKTSSCKHKILIVDDQRVNLVITKNKIEKNLDFICDLAENGSDAISLVKANNYKLILMDIQMPEMNGIEAAAKIRTINKNVPIVGLTSLEYDEIWHKMKKDFNHYLYKPVAGHILHRTVEKILMQNDEEIDYLGEKEQYLEVLDGKKVLLADDQDVNRLVMKKTLISAGLKVTEVNDGKALLEYYNKGLKKDKTSKYDIILTDINMPPFNGDEASKEIRKIEKENGITYKKRTPIIALSGNGQKEDIDNFFVSGMDDYFIKGSRVDNLIKIIAIYLSPTKVYLNSVKSLEESGKKQNSKKKTTRKRLVLNPEKLRYFNKSDRKEFLETFLKDSEDMIDKIIRNHKEDNLKELSLTLHAFKGVTGNIGADKLSAQIAKLEETINSGILPANQNWLNDLQKSYEKLTKDIKNIL